jgi:hypothetical protein
VTSPADELRTAADEPTDLVRRASITTSYHRYTFDPDPNIPSRRFTNLAVADATNLARVHFRAYPSLRSITAEPYGAITFLQANRHIMLQPGMDARPSLLTARQADDLLLIAGVGSRARITLLPGRGTAIDAGLHRIPPAATERLIKHGWIATPGRDGAAVEVSLAGTVAMAWRACRGLGVSGERCAGEIAESVHSVYAP